MSFFKVLGWQPCKIDFSLHTDNSRSGGLLVPFTLVHLGFESDNIQIAN